MLRWVWLTLLARQTVWFIKKPKIFRVAFIYSIYHFPSRKDRQTAQSRWRVQYPQVGYHIRLTRIEEVELWVNILKWRQVTWSFNIRYWKLMFASSRQTIISCWKLKSFNVMTRTILNTRIFPALSVTLRCTASPTSQYAIGFKAPAYTESV